MCTVPFVMQTEYFSVEDGLFLGHVEVLESRSAESVLEVSNLEKQKETCNYIVF
jgi:hypothetical protein